MINQMINGLKTKARKRTRRQCRILGAGSALILTIGTTPIHAALPDRAVQTLVSQIYSHHWATDRTGCDYYLNPNDLNQRGGQQRLTVWRTQGKSGGSACNGVFEFEVLTADCEKGDLSISNEVGSPASWVRRQYRNSAIVREVCGGLEQLIPSQMRLLQSLSHPPVQSPVAPIPLITRQEAIDLVKA